MTVHIFKFDDWFMNKQEDWDADFYYLVVSDDDHRITLINAGSQYWEEQMRKTYPDRVEHEFTLSRHRGKLESSPDVIAFKEQYPRIWEKLNRWCEFK